MSKLILKILVGQQAGAEVMLDSGEYSLGSGRDDDLQIADLSLNESHMRLKIDGNKIQIAANKGDVQTEGGLSLSAGASDWVEIEPLDVISVGVVKVALGAKNAQWATLSQALKENKEVEAPAPERKRVPVSETVFGEHSDKVNSALGRVGGHGSKIAAAVGGLAFIVLAFYAVGSGRIAPGSANALPNGGIADVREAISELPFARDLNLRKEVDDQIYLSGYVDKAVERRAITEAVERTGVPVNVRVRVLETLQRDIAAFLESRGSKVKFTLSDEGVLTLRGSILDKKQADQLVSELRGLYGVLKVDSKIKSSGDYLGDVRNLAKRALIDDTIIFRIDDKETLEVSGVIASQDLDRWSGFLRSYSRQYADYIPLRSLVKLVQENGQIVDLQANLAGSSPNAEAGRLASRTLPQSNETIEARQEEVLKLARQIKKKEQVKVETQQAEKYIKKVAAKQKEVKSLVVKVGDNTNELQAATERLLNKVSALSSKLDRVGKAASQKTEEVAPKAEAKGTVAEVSKENAATEKALVEEKVLKEEKELNDAAELVFLAWQETGDGVEIPEAFKEKFLPLLVTSEAKGELCADDLRIPVSQISVAVFWLDLLSGSETLDLSTFPEERQQLVLEAAINPAMTRKCLLKAKEKNGVDLSPYSNFIKESIRNPNFIRFLTRDLVRPTVRISGASLIGDRYIQSRDNNRYMIGQSTSNSSRLVAIGELGALIREYDGYSVVLYEDEAAWVVRETVASLP